MCSARRARQPRQFVATNAYASTLASCSALPASPCLRSRNATSRRTPAWIIPALRPLAPSPRAPLSTTTTCFPCDAMRAAAVKPVNPAPTTTASAVAGSADSTNVGKRGVVPPERASRGSPRRVARYACSGGPGVAQRLIIYSTVTSSTGSDSVPAACTPSCRGVCPRGRHPHRRGRPARRREPVDAAGMGAQRAGPPDACRRPPSPLHVR